MAKELENGLVRNLQLNILQEFFKIQMEAAFGNNWKTRVESVIRANVGTVSTYQRIADKIDEYGLANFNEKSLDITALMPLLKRGNAFKRQCEVCDHYHDHLDNIRDDKNALVSHLSNPASINEVSELIHHSLTTLTKFLNSLEASNWAYPKKNEFVEKYREKIADFNDETKEKSLRGIPLEDLKNMVGEKIPEAQLELYLRITNGTVPQEERDTNKAQELLEEAVEAGNPEAMARLAFKTIVNAEDDELEINKAAILLGRAMEKGSKFAHFVYGNIEEFGDINKKPNLTKAFKHYCDGAAAGCLEAQIKKAYFLAIGKGTDPDLLQGLGQLNSIAKTTNSPLAYLRLGMYYISKARDIGNDKTKQKVKEQYYTEAFNAYFEGAKSGDRRLEKALAVQYFNGRGVERNLPEAFRLLKSASDKGYMSAKKELGKMYYYGIYVKQDYKTAYEYFEEAASSGNGEANYMLGLCLYNGYGVEQNDNLAFSTFEKIADDMPEAKYMLGRLYEDGRGTDSYVKNPIKAITCYKEAAESGNSDAQYILGLRYKTGEIAAPSPQNAFKWFKEAAENGNVNAMYELSLCYKKGFGVTKDADEAFTFLEKAAEGGNSNAQYDKGTRYIELHCDYLNGCRSGLLKEDKLTEYQYRRAAFKWYKKAADQGHSEAAERVADFYIEGAVIENNITEAIKYYKIAMKGNGYEALRAANALGRMYLMGEDVDQDHTLAYKYFVCAKNAKLVAYCNYYGVGVDKNYKVALNLFDKLNEQEVTRSWDEEENEFYDDYDTKFLLMKGRCQWQLKDYNAAYKSFEAAANNGNILANYFIGACYFYGLGRVKDLKDAAKHFKIVSTAFMNGTELFKEDYETIAFIEKLMNIKNSICINNELLLGDCYAADEKTKFFAKPHYRKAAMMGSQNAREKLEKYFAE